MAPEEPQSEPASHSRPPYPRHFHGGSIDGLSRRSFNRPPVSTGHPVHTPRPEIVTRPSSPGSYVGTIMPTTARHEGIVQPMQNQAPPQLPPISTENLQGPANPVPQTTVTNPAPVNTPAAITPSTTSQQPPLAFTPPTGKKKRKLVKYLIPATIVIVFMLAGGGIAYWLHIQSVDNNPTTVFKDAILANLSANQLEVNTNTPGNSIDSSFDFTNLTDPLVSSQAAVNLYGANFQINGYGSAQNSYISYSSFPSFTSSSVSVEAKNAWVQLRSNGVLPPGVNASLSNLADPRFQDFGPLIFGDFPYNTRLAMYKYIVNQEIYTFKLKDVTHSVLNDTKVYVYPLKLNIGILKILVESAASSEGFSPSDVQAAVNDLGIYKGATATLYVSASTHRVVQLNLVDNGQTTNISYSGYNSVVVSGQPETNLSWQDFATVQQQIELQAASHESAAALDAQRKTDLSEIHSYLATYFNSSGYYPAYADLDDQTWVASNLPGLDPDGFRDPLSSSPALSTVPKAEAYAYIPLSPSGKSCDDNVTAVVSQLCTTYTLTAILSNGQHYSVTNP
jgi:hypothetical protein